MLKTAMIFTDHMVLQRQKAVPIWGEADPGRKIRVRIKDVQAFAEADDHGNWKAVLPALEAGSGYELEIVSEEERIVLKDICIGEVWLAGGQSNMEYLLGFEKHFREELKKPMHELVRFFDYPEAAYEGALEDFDYKNDGFWRLCTEKDLPWFSAAGYYFACRISEELEVPVGIVGCNWGGTPACAWMDPEDLKGTAGEVWLREYEEAVKGLDLCAYRKRFLEDPGSDRTNRIEEPFALRFVLNSPSYEEQLRFMKEEMEGTEPLPVGPYYERRPGGVYESMLKKVCPYAVRGILYYQGETDGDFHPHAYREVLPGMIRGWRKLWEEELPFLMVQLAPFGKWMMCDGKDYPIIRLAQAQTAASVPGVYMISSSDAGMEWDIHPKDKKVIGERLALMAQEMVYNRDVCGRAPQFKEACFTGETVVITFSDADGLHTENGPIRELFGITAAGEKKKIEAVRIEEDRMIFEDGDFVKIRFAMDPYHEVNLYNKAHLPAHPFEIERGRN